MFQQNSFNRINAAGMEKTLVLQGLSPSQLIYSCHSDRCAQSNAPDRPKSLAPFRTTKKMWFHGFLVVVMLLAPVACCRKSVLEKDYGHSWAYKLKPCKSPIQGPPLTKRPLPALVLVHR